MRSDAICTIFSFVHMVRVGAFASGRVGDAERLGALLTTTQNLLRDLLFWATEVGGLPACLG